MSHLVTELGFIKGLVLTVNGLMGLCSKKLVVSISLTLFWFLVCLLVSIFIILFKWGGLNGLYGQKGLGDLGLQSLL